MSKRATQPRWRTFAWALILLLGGCGGPSASSDPPPITAVATVAPLAALVRAVAGPRAGVTCVAAGARRVSDYGDRDPSQVPYRPDPATARTTREAAFLAVDGRCDGWSLGGLSPELVTSGTGPVLRLDAQPAARDAPDGALWLDPLVLAQAARDAAGRLAVLRPGDAALFRDNADHLADRLQGLAEGRSPRWAKVVVVGDEPGPLLARLGIAFVRVAPEDDRVVASPERVAEAARRFEAQAVVLSADWAGPTRDAWSAAVGVPVALYRPLGRADLPSVPDPAQALVDWSAANVNELTTSGGG